MTEDAAVGERLARIETKLDLLISKDDDHETRLRDLEKSKWRLPAISAGLASLLSGGGATALQQILTNGA